MTATAGLDRKILCCLCTSLANLPRINIACSQCRAWLVVVLLLFVLSIQVRLWDPYDMACIRVLEELNCEVTAMTYCEGWNLVVTGELVGQAKPAC